MGTPAAVYLERFDKTVRVNYDGYKSHMIPTLTRLIEDDLLESFVAHPEYSSLVETEEEFERFAKEGYNARYVSVAGVGFAYPEDDSFESVTVWDGADSYIFDNDAPFEYVITRAGEIIVHKGYDEEED